MDQPLNGTAKPEQLPEERALSALKRLARPQPKAFDQPHTGVPEYPLGAGSATGFVGTLAKSPADESLAGASGAFGPDDSHAGEADDSRAGGGIAQDVQAGAGSLAGAAASAVPPRPSGELIQMAREINVSRPASPLSNRPAGSVSGRRATHGGLVAIMVALGIVLLAIGGWAIGALAYMHQITPLSPRDIHYPLLLWNGDLQTFGAYARGSVIMAWGMLACLPVGIVLLTGAISVRRRAIRPK